MKILNIMLGKGLGGLEQVFLDYTEALQKYDHHVISVIHPGSALREKVRGSYHTLYNLNKYDPIAIYRLKRLILREQPDVTITHGNRATTLFRKTKLNAPHIAVCHNYQIGPLIGSHNLITLTEDIKEHALQAGQTPDSIHVVPNMIHLPSHFKHESQLHSPLRIGFLGRFDPKKGAQLFLQALSHLKEKNIPFNAILGGDGPEREHLQNLAASLNILNEIYFSGWITDKDEFFSEIDILCIPSFKEAFGLVLLEAFAYGKAVVSTSTPGPSAIATQEEDVLFSAVGESHDLAQNLQRLIEDSDLREKLRAGGYETVQRYTPEIISARLNEVIHAVT